MAREGGRSFPAGVAVGAILAAILLLAIGLVAYFTVSRPSNDFAGETKESPSPTDRSRSTESAQAVPLATAGAKGELAASRRADAAGESRPNRQRIRDSVTLVCALVDPAGAPVRSGAVVIASNDDNATRQEFTGGSASFAEVDVGKWSVAAMALGRKFTRKEVEVRGDVSPLVVTIVMEPDPQGVVVRIVGPDGKRLVETLPPSDAGRLTAILSLVTTRAALSAGEAIDELAGEELSRDKRVWVERIGGMRMDRDHRPLDADFDGYVHTLVERPWFLSLVADRIVVDCQLVDPMATVVTFRVDPASLLQRMARVRLRVVDAATGKAIPEATVSVGRMTMLPVSDHRATRSDKTGAAVFDGVAPGSNFLEIRARGYAITYRCFESTPRQTVELGDVGLSRGVTFAGTVLSPDGKSVDAQLCLLPPLGAAAGEPSNRSFPQIGTGRDGEFRFTDLSPGSYTLQIRPTQDFAATAVPVEIPERGIEGMRVELKEGTMVNIRRDLQRIESIYLGVVTSQGCHIVDSLLGGDVIAQRGLLEPGRYTLQLRRKGGDLREIPLTVGKDPVTITIP